MPMNALQLCLKRDTGQSPGSNFDSFETCLMATILLLFPMVKID